MTLLEYAMRKGILVSKDFWDYKNCVITLRTKATILNVLVPIDHYRKDTNELFELAIRYSTIDDILEFLGDTQGIDLLTTYLGKLNEQPKYLERE